MPYANVTDTYRIPWWAQDERSSGVSNARAAKIIDVQLRGVSRLIGQNGVMEEGVYSASFSSGNSTVTLEEDGIHYAMEALIDGEYVAQNEDILWEGLPNNQTIYLYIQALEQNTYQSNEKSTLAQGKAYPTFNLTGLTPEKSLLVGIATTTGSAITLDTSATVSDNGEWTTGRPFIYSYTEHRLNPIIDHPEESVVRGKLAENSIVTKNIHPWDGFTSGTSTSGTGVGTLQLKDEAVTLPKLAPDVIGLALSGLTAVAAGYLEVVSFTSEDIVIGLQPRQIYNAVISNNLSGAGAYTSNFVLAPPPSNHSGGSVVEFFFEIAASDNPSITIRSLSTSGTIIRSLSGDSEGDQYINVRTVFTGSRWRVLNYES